MIMCAVCRHTDKGPGLAQEGAGPCRPRALPATCPLPLPCPPTVSLLSPHLCPLRGSPAVLIRLSSSLLTPGLSLSLTSALSHPALLCLCLPSPCLPLLPSLGSGKNTAHFSFSWFSADMGAAPALCQDFPLAREPTSPNSLPSGAS